MIYNISVHFICDPDDVYEYNDEFEGDNIEQARQYVLNTYRENYDGTSQYCDIDYYTVESEDGEEYYNSSDEPNWEDRC